MLSIKTASMNLYKNRKKETTFQSLPNNILTLIFTYLNWEDLNKTAQTSKKFHQINKDTLKNNINNIIFKLSKKSNEVDQIKSLRGVSSSLEKKTSYSDKSILNLKVQLISILSSLDSDILLELSQDCSPSIYEDVFDIANQVNASESSIKKIAEEFINNKEYNKAILTYHLMPDESDKNHSLYEITTYLASNKLYSKAHTTAHLISDPAKRGFALYKISEFLTVRGDTKKATEMKNEIPNDILSKIVIPTSDQNEIPFPSQKDESCTII